MPNGTITPGQIVRSTAGRDAGHAYVVLGWNKPQTLLVADGRGRKVASPKKKTLSTSQGILLLLIWRRY